MSFFRTYINRNIQEELFTRVKSINFNSSQQGILDSVQTSVVNQYVKSCWARISVVLGNGEVVYLNSNLDENNNPINEPLNIKNGKPYRGKPGITSISTSFKEYFMKQGTINFYVPNGLETTNDGETVQQFDLFKDRFLRFGRYMLVEFGWTLPYNTTLPALSAETIIDFSQGLTDRIVKAKGNYNAMVGVVTNYNFNQTKEGAYEGTIELSSMGRNIIGQKNPKSSESDKNIENVVGYINETLAGLKENRDLKEKQKKSFAKLRETYISFQSVINKLDRVVEDYVSKDENKIRKPDKILKATADVSVTPGLGGAKETEIENEVYRRNGTYMFQDSLGSNGGGDRKKVILLSWGWFEDFILNSYFSFVSSNEKVKFKTEFFSADTIASDSGDFLYFNNRCKSHPELYSLGFDSIILPGNTKTFGRKNSQYSNLLKELVDDSNTNLYKFEDFKGRGIIRNMFFNVDYLKESFMNTENVEQSIINFWKKVSSDYGYFWNFSLVENERIDGRMMITDMNTGQEESSNKIESYSTEKNPDKIFKFKVYSQNSIVSSLDLQTANTSEMATLAVYGSNTKLDVTSADSGQGYTELAMRALSMIDNPDVSNNTTTKIKRSQYYDNILENISSPVFKNFTDPKQKFEGSSAEYNADGELDIDRRNRSGGIEFSNIEDIKQTEKETKKSLRHILYGTGYSSSEEEIANTLFWFREDDKNVQIYEEKDYTMISEFKRTMLFRINKAPGTSSNYSTVLPVIPIQLSLTLQGIGGIKVGDLFGVDYLPEQYKNYCNFMVVNVDHEISPTGWTTKLDSRMIVDIPKFLEDNDSVQLDEIDYKLVNTNLEDEKLIITRYYQNIRDRELNKQRGQDIVDDAIEKENNPGFFRKWYRNSQNKRMERITNSG